MSKIIDDAIDALFDAYEETDPDTFKAIEALEAAEEDE